MTVRPEMLLLPLAQRLDIGYDALRRGLDNLLQRRRERLQRALVALESLSPLAVLARGYSVTRDENGAVLTDAGVVETGAVIETILSCGRLASRVTEVRESLEKNGETSEKSDL